MLGWLFLPGRVSWSLAVIQPLPKVHVFSVAFRMKLRELRVCRERNKFGVPGRASGSYEVIQPLPKVIERDFQHQISEDSTKLPRFEQIVSVCSFELVWGVPGVV